MVYVGIRIQDTHKGPDSKYPIAIISNYMQMAHALWSIIVGTAKQKIMTAQRIMVGIDELLYYMNLVLIDSK